MKMITTLLLCILLLFIPGCSWLNKAMCGDETIIEYRTVVPAPPAELYSIPPYVKKLDLPPPSQQDVAKWIAENWSRQVELEERIIKLHDYQTQLEERHKNDPKAVTDQKK